MNEYPLDSKERQQQRDEHLEREVLRGTMKGLHYGRSPRCERGDHRRWSRVLTDYTGCKNDGTGCLCFCHDGMN